MSTYGGFGTYGGLYSAPGAGTVCAQGPLGYLEFCGVEVANDARTLTYLRSGLGNTQRGRIWTIGDLTGLCGVLWRLNGGTVSVPDVYASPSADPAPWYDAAEPGSTSFLGLLLQNIEGYDGVYSRAVTERVGRLGGGIFGSQRARSRVWKFTAALISADDAGAEYGLRWLKSTLAQAACAACDSCDAKIRLTCPPTDGLDDAQGEWLIYDIALVDGPHETSPWAPRSASLSQTWGGSRDVVMVEWTMTAVNPYLHKRPVECLAPEAIGVFAPDCDEVYSYPAGFYFGGAPFGGGIAVEGAPGVAHTCSVTAPSRGVLSTVFTLSSVSGMGGVLLEAYHDCIDTTDPVLQMRLSGVPAGNTVTVDSGRRTITVRGPDPTITRSAGTLTTGGSWSGNFPDDYKDVSLRTLTEDAFVTGIWVYMRNGAGSIKAVPVAYSNVAAAPVALLATGLEIVLPVFTEAWRFFPFAGGGVLFDAGSYWFGLHTGGGASSPTLNYAYDVGGQSGYNTAIADTYADGPSDPFGAFTSNGFDVSLYVAYNPPFDQDGQSLLQVGSRGIEWIEVRDCDTGIGCVGARVADPCSQGGDTTVQIETQIREL